MRPPAVLTRLVLLSCVSRGALAQGFHHGAWIDPGCESEILTVSPKLNKVCCLVKSNCHAGLPVKCTVACAKIWNPYVKRCAPYVSRHFPHLVSLAAKCAAAAPTTPTTPPPPPPPLGAHGHGKCRLSAESKKATQLCCPGSGHRRSLQACALPKVCPTQKCARGIQEFFESCQATFRTTWPKSFGKFQAFYENCQTKFPAKARALLADDFEHGLGSWRGKNGKSKPFSAKLVKDSDPKRGYVLQTQKCVGGGDAFSALTVDCTVQDPCLVEYDVKGRGWQGFSSGFPAHHVWTATPTEYSKQTLATTVHDTTAWHHVSYVYPVKKGYPGGKSGSVHFMLEGFDRDCHKTSFDNILVTRASTRNFCDGVDRKSYIKLCDGVTEWHKSIDMSAYTALPVCNVHVATHGSTCREYCKSQGRVCRHAQDNIGATCKLDAHHTRQSVGNNGCDQKWGDQICGCAEQDPGIDSTTFTFTSNAGSVKKAQLRTRHGSECSVYKQKGGCNGYDSGRCGVTEDGELYAYYHDAVAWCEDNNPLCGFRMGKLVKSGCSRAERVGYWVECCHTPKKKVTDIHDCKTPIDFKTDASTKCENHITSGHTDMSALEIIGASTGDKSFSQCKQGCELQRGVAGWNSCDVCSCLFGCQSALTGKNFESCSAGCSMTPPLDLVSKTTCDAKTRCKKGHAVGCNFGCRIPSTASSTKPPSLRYKLDGNLQDSAGKNHAEDHFHPPLKKADVRFTSGHTAAAGPREALTFSGDDYLELKSPFPSADTHFSITIWLKPGEIDFDGWHSIIGYQAGGVCPGRSPSLYVDGGCHGDSSHRNRKAAPCQQAGGLCWDSCDISDKKKPKRNVGVVPNVFTSTEEWVAIAWVKEGEQYRFYKNGELAVSTKAPKTVQLSAKYRIGHNDNYFVGLIDEVGFYNRALSDASVWAEFKGQTSLVFTARSNEGPKQGFSKIRVKYGRECQLYWKNGKCNGIDAGRCGVTENGELYAWFLGADSWCKEADPFCGFVMGKPVKTGCSTALRPGTKYFVECCVNEQKAGDTVQFASKDCSDQPALRFSFDNSLEDDAGANHGKAHFKPPLSSKDWGYAHDGTPKGSLHFSGDDYVQLEAPFPSKDSHFTIVLWLKPEEIDMDGWHSIVGYQTQPWSVIGKHGGCPGRSPGLWVDGGCHGDAARKDRKKHPCPSAGGLHWWTCDVTNPKAPKPVAGVVPGIFKKTSEWVHIAWVKQGSELRFYRNGQKVHTFPNAPAEIELSDKYNIGHNDNFFVGNIGEVAFYDRAMSTAGILDEMDGHSPMVFAVPWQEDASARCTASNGNGDRSAKNCEESCTAHFGSSTEAACACTRGCLSAEAGHNFESCQNSCSHRKSVLGQCSTDNLGREGWCAGKRLRGCISPCIEGCSIPFRRTPVIKSKLGSSVPGLSFTAKYHGGSKHHATWKAERGKECELTSTPGKCNERDSARCGVTENGELYAWIFVSSAACHSREPACAFKTGPPVRTGCSSVSHMHHSVSCCVAKHSDKVAPKCPNEIDWKLDASSQCSASKKPNACQNLQGSKALHGKSKICVDKGTTCEFYTQTQGRTCSAVCNEAGLTCLDGWDDDPNTKEPCDHHLIAGRQSGHQIDHSDVSSKQSSKSGAHNYGVGGCLNPYGNQICKCSASRKCEIDTEYPFSWVDIIGTGTGTKITKWIQNQDDGWFHVNIPWGFPWFGKVEHKITIGTNGVITFGKNQLHNGATEPVPCSWEAGKAVQGGKKVKGCVGNNYGSSGTANGVPPDGVIAPFWADLDTSKLKGKEGVYYLLEKSSNPTMHAWNKLVIQYQVRVFKSNLPVHFECILFGDGTVIFQYLDMPHETKSWSHESIGFEDQSGKFGVQISYGKVPSPSTAYHIPASCHMASSKPACDVKCALKYGKGTANACACTFGCKSARKGQNFAQCTHTCDTKCDDNDECTGCGCGQDKKCCSVQTNTLGKLSPKDKHKGGGKCCESPDECEDPCNKGCAMGQK